MVATKFAISVPEDVMSQIDRAARKRRVTRSRFISDVLRKVATARTDAEISRRVNELFSDPEIAAEQRTTAHAFQRASSSAGTRW
jgi:metal-responsive CopG/Arc/MetJ family transcriptional regulator